MKCLKMKLKIHRKHEKKVLVWGLIIDFKFHEKKFDTILL